MSMTIDSKPDVRFSPRSFFLLIAITLLSILPYRANGDTIHHWRFESAGFLADSVGDADLT